jgi:hypothetical protein
MAYNRLSCYSTTGNTGIKKLCSNDIGVLDGLILVPVGTSIATEVLALTESTWKTAFKTTTNNRWFPMPLATAVTPESQEDKYFDRPLKGQKFISEGKDAAKLMYDLNIYSHTQLRKFNNQEWAAYRIDGNGNILGWSSDGIKFQPFDLQEFHVGKMTETDGSTGVETPVKIVWKTPEQWNDSGVLLSPTFDPREWEGVYNIDLTVTTPTTSSATLDIKFLGSDKGVDGLVKADLLVKNSSNVTQTITTLTGNGNGNYTLAYTWSAGNYTITTVAASAISLTEFAIETATTATFTIS